MNSILFFDLEIAEQSKVIVDIGGISSEDKTWHANRLNDFVIFANDYSFWCGHNIIEHDLRYLKLNSEGSVISGKKIIDTLLLCPLLFPMRPYYRLLKDDKLQTDDLNNPLNDAKKARDLFYEELIAFQKLPGDFKRILFYLLKDKEGFKSFFDFAGYEDLIAASLIERGIRAYFNDRICQTNDLASFINEHPVALAYSLSLLNCNDRYSVTPAWVLRNYPQVEMILFSLRNKPCSESCNYCRSAFDPTTTLKKHFGFSSFRLYDEKPLQENAVRAAVSGKSILCVFPTGGGKSITFQVPALMSGENASALTVVISPLQSLMKDQVDNLEKKGIVDAVTINGLLDPIERSKSIERIENGSATLLYISPESLRSVTIERLLLKRKIARFIIDEAHCFSSWGQDFRVDYLYIGPFIRNLLEKKSRPEGIPVSCFTATAKHKVIVDICEYFKKELGIELEIFKAGSARKNLHYKVIRRNTEDEKYIQLRDIIESKECSAIVYVSRTKKADKLAERLSADGFRARAFHGKMTKEDKVLNQDAFMNGAVDIMVATSAFGMGVDKSDVETVIHYDISDSLENYIQEAGRAGRDEKISADCYVLFNEDDLDKHFVLLNQTKISIKEINQIWKAIKDLTKTRNSLSNSALEIARRAGWDEGINEIETRVTTAIAALEDAGYLKRGQNIPRVYANSILSKNAQEAISKIESSSKFDPDQKMKAVRIIKKLFSSKSKRLSTEEQAESRIDYISDQLGIKKEEVIRVITLLREEGILADTKDLTAFIKSSEASNRSLHVLDTFRKIEEKLSDLMSEESSAYHLKELNEKLESQDLTDCTPARIKTIINFWSIKKWVDHQNLDYSKNHIRLQLKQRKDDFKAMLAKRHYLAKGIVEHLYKRSREIAVSASQSDVLVEFSVQELKEVIAKKQDLFVVSITLDDVEDALFYLSRIDAIKIEGGFLVVHNRLYIDRVETNNSIQYKKSDYEKLSQFYEQKVQQIHIVGEYAKKMIQSYNDALRFVDDYFNLNYRSFLSKYFPGSRQNEISRTLTPEKFQRLFGALSPSQLEIITDSNQHIVVAAGPGSGKTRVLVHKLASLLFAEDIKHEQLLMLTFSRSAATEFKRRLLQLIGSAAHYVEIKTFHSYCFDLLGRVGNLEQAGSIIKLAVDKIQKGEIEFNRVAKMVLVVDEAQDMNADEYSLVRTLIQLNDDMRVILVGDDDQNIYQFRGSDSLYMHRLITEQGAIKYELIENYRSKSNIVSFSNAWAESIQNRLKENPGIAISQDNGTIEICQYKTREIIFPFVNAIKGKSLSGSTCVLTRTNDEAAAVTGMLMREGIAARLIQSNEGFRLANLYELRFFCGLVEKNSELPQIDEDDWMQAILTLKGNFAQSNKLELALKVISDFGSVNTNRKYKSDWKDFLQESKFEDFMAIDSEMVYVSTVHKAKGKEFDNVFVLLCDLDPFTDDAKRQLFVGITRAKNNLVIHYNGTFLNGIHSENLQYKIDLDSYPKPQELAMALTLSDVWLGYFANFQSYILAMRSGERLLLSEKGLNSSNGRNILRYSQSFKLMIEQHKANGYVLVQAKVNFVVYWKDPNADKELLTILPELIFRRQ